MVCASVREDDPRGLLPVQTHRPFDNFLIASACIGTSIVYCNFNKRFNLTPKFIIAFHAQLN